MTPNGEMATDVFIGAYDTNTADNELRAIERALVDAMAGYSLADDEQYAAACANLPAIKGRAKALVAAALVPFRARPMTVLAHRRSDGSKRCLGMSVLYHTAERRCFAYEFAIGYSSHLGITATPLLLS